MKSLALTLCLLGAAITVDSSALAQGTYLCAAMCGTISTPTSDLQGASILQVMATGGDEPTAFANLQAKCKAIADKNPNAPTAITLYVGYSLSTYGNADNGVNLVGTGYPATVGNSCLAL